MTCDLTARPRVILGYLIAINAGDGATTERRTRINPPDEGSEDAGVQECGISPAISVRLRCHLQHLQRPAAPHISKDAPGVPSLGHANMARGRRCGMIAIECTICRVIIHQRDNA